MDPNRVDDTTQRVAGNIEEATGSLVGDSKTEAGGQARQPAGDTQDSLDHVMQEIREFTTEQPFAALLTAGGIGLVLGMFLARR
jgi:uncharacterized protein YjbJ (UPF0337 family)